MSWTWLRDHARHDGSHLASAQQRIVGPGTIAAAGVGEARLSGDDLEVSWPDGPTTVFPAVQMSYNHHDRAPFVLPEPLMTELYTACSSSTPRRLIVGGYVNREDFESTTRLLA